jgi:hypothetical protein
MQAGLTRALEILEGAKTVETRQRRMKERSGIVLPLPVAATSVL